MVSANKMVPVLEPLNSCAWTLLKGKTLVVILRYKLRKDKKSKCWGFGV